MWRRSFWVDLLPGPRQIDIFFSRRFSDSRNKVDLIDMSGAVGFRGATRLLW